ncbi:MAG: hypothetical protein ACP5VP_06530 [Candidatus Limnocylindrales bacterium]
MPRLQPNDPKSLESPLTTFGTRDLEIDPDDIADLLDQADEEIREADWDLKGKFPNGVLKSAEMAILKMALALALGYCRRLAKRDEFNPEKGQRAHRNAALLLWFWSKEALPQAEPVAGQLVDIVTARNNYGYDGWTVALSEAEDFADLVKEMRVDLGDAPVQIFEQKMAELAAAQAQGTKPAKVRRS